MKKVTILFSAFLMLFSATSFAESYNIWIAGVRIRDANQNDITAAIVAAGKTATGTITYDPTTNTLTLNNATLNVNDDGIENQISNLTINLLGNNYITADEEGIKSDQADFTITGSGSLTITASYGIWHKKCNLTIENTSITATGNEYGIRGFEGNNEILTINNSIVKATGTNLGSIAFINNLVLNNCAITQPTDASFDAEQFAVCLNGAVEKTEVVIEPRITPTTYELYVTGVQINDTNKNDITSAITAQTDVTASGTITYDQITNTLTLDNATLHYSSGDLEVNIIHNRISNLTINLIGENIITSNQFGNGIFSYQADFKITGSGSLSMDSSTCYMANGIYYRECNLTIENTTVTANGKYYGIGGYNSNSGNLTINNSTVRAMGTSQGSIAKINNLLLNDCFISQPEGAAFDESSSPKGIYYNGELVTTEVVITPTNPVAIEENINENIIFQVNGKELTVVNTENLPIRIYNLVGQEIAYKENSNNQESFDLPQTGVYIVKIGNKSEKIFIK